MQGIIVTDKPKIIHPSHNDTLLRSESTFHKIAALTIYAAGHKVKVISLLSVSPNESIICHHHSSYINAIKIFPDCLRMRLDAVNFDLLKAFA